MTSLILLAVIAIAIAVIVFFIWKRGHDALESGVSAGRTEAERDALEAEFEALERANAARRGVDHSPDSVRNDPRNRDRMLGVPADDVLGEPGQSGDDSGDTRPQRGVGQTVPEGGAEMTDEEKAFIARVEKALPTIKSYEAKVKMFLALSYDDLERTVKLARERLEEGTDQ